MTTNELEKKVRISRTTYYGHYKVTITFRTKEYSCTTTDSLAYDAIHEGEETKGYYTYKQALTAIYNECKRKNGLL